MEQRCRVRKELFEVTNDDLDVLHRVSPILGGKRYDIPPPTLSPECRFQLRLAFRNERFLHRRKSDLSGKQIISIFSPDSPYKVYDQSEWWSDAWNALDYGRDFDFSRTFTEQYSELTRDVPHMSLYTTNTENSYYTNYCLNVRNCYLAFGTTECEDCLYTKFNNKCEDCVDCLMLFSCNICYEGSASQNCYDCKFFQNCRNCTSCLFIEDCQSCSDCALCFGLESAQYHVLNTDLGKVEYEKFIESISPLTNDKLDELQRRFDELKLKMPHRESHIYASENCSGDAIFNSRNCHQSFNIDNCEDCKYAFCCPNSVMAHDVCFTAPDGAQYSYNLCSSQGTSNSMSTFLSWNNDSAFYTMECNRCENLFGCIGLRQKQYCIFNKQYSQEDYENLAGRIITHMRETGEWGEYFHPSLSFFGYNETVAQEYFPLSAEQAKNSGWQWTIEEDKESRGVLVSDLPESIEKIEDSILNDVIQCAETAKGFKLTPLELRFYKKNNIPLPRFAPDHRHQKRVLRLNPPELWKRSCAKTGVAIWTNYAPERPERVYSNEAFLDERSGEDFDANKAEIPKQSKAVTPQSRTKTNVEGKDNFVNAPHASESKESIAIASDHDSASIQRLSTLNEEIRKNAYLQFSHALTMLCQHEGFQENYLKTEEYHSLYQQLLFALEHPNPSETRCKFISALFFGLVIERMAGKGPSLPAMHLEKAITLETAEWQILWDLFCLSEAATMKTSSLAELGKISGVAPLAALKSLTDSLIQKDLVAVANKTTKAKEKINYEIGLSEWGLFLCTRLASAKHLLLLEYTNRE